MAGAYIEIIAKATMASAGANAKNLANVFHFRRASLGSAFVKANINSAFQTAIMAKVLLAASADYVQAGTTVRMLDDATDPPVTFSESGPGAIATDRVPDICAAVFQLKTPIKGKSGRGSKHFGGVCEAHTTADLLNSTGITLWSAVGAAMLAGFSDSDGNSWVLGINSHKPPAAWLVNPVTIVWNDVSSVLLNKNLGVMRRRRVKTVN